MFLKKAGSFFQKHCDVFGKSCLPFFEEKNIRNHIHLYPEETPGYIRTYSMIIKKYKGQYISENRSKPNFACRFGSVLVR